MEETMRRRGDVSSKSKAIAALEAVKAQEPIGAIARRYKVHPIQVGKWRKRLLEDMHRIFEDDPSADAAAHEREVQELYEQIGRLKVENDFLKKKSALGG
jgi:transposase-like protein